MRFIGDIHGKYEEYSNVKNQSEKSIQFVEMYDNVRYICLPELGFIDIWKEIK